MDRTRSFACGLWGDPWVEEQDAAAKLLFINLFTNTRTTQCGCVAVTTAAISFETRIPEAQVVEILTRWTDEEDAHVMWWPKLRLVWVTRFVERQCHNPNFGKSAIMAASQVQGDAHQLIFERTCQQVYRMHEEINGWLPHSAKSTVKSPSGGENNGNKPNNNGTVTVTEPLGNHSATVSQQLQNGMPTVWESDQIRKDQERSDQGICAPTLPLDAPVGADTHKPAKRFVKPTVDEVRAYFLERGYVDESERFWNFYESKGWKVGKNPMVSWKSAISNWGKPAGSSPPPEQRPEPIVSRPYVSQFAQPLRASGTTH